MLAVAYCYLVSVYATLTLHGLQFADNVGWRTTTSFIFHLDVLRLLNFLFTLVLFHRFWHSAHFRNAQRHAARLYIFLVFMSVFGIWPIFEIHRGMWPGYTFFSFS